MDLGLAGAAAVVTGGSKGMGRATALCLAAEGARVCILARGRAALDETVAALTASGSPDAFGLSVDIGNAGEIDAAFRTVGERWGSSTAWSTRPAPTPATSSRSAMTTSTSTSPSAR